MCVIDPQHATVTGLRVASTQETMGTDSRWQRQSGLTQAKCYFLIGAIAGGLIFCVQNTCCVACVVLHVLQSKQSSMVEDGTTSGFSCVLPFVFTLELTVTLWDTTNGIFTGLAKYTGQTTAEAHHNPVTNTHTHTHGLRLHSEGCHCSVQGHTDFCGDVTSQTAVLTWLNYGKLTVQ